MKHEYIWGCVLLVQNLFLYSVKSIFYQKVNPLMFGPCVVPLMHWTTNASWYIKTPMQAPTPALMPNASPNGCPNVRWNMVTVDLHWACQFHVVCQFVVRIDYLTQVWFLMEYRLKWIAGILADGKYTLLLYKQVSQAQFISTFKIWAI